LRRDTRAALRHVDALLVPTTMIAALPVEQIDAGMETYMTRNAQYLRNTAIGNILGLCGLSVPCGFTARGLPIGLMIYGQPFAEETILRIGHAYEQAAGLQGRVPELGWAG
jgi:aspartyl-tRNA(Asn)/glutamyl-tRNA(Gln) amidotransferase subunit A